MINRTRPRRQAAFMLCLAATFFGALIAEAVAQAIDGKLTTLRINVGKNGFDLTY
jgi:hypothetical protein